VECKLSVLTQDHSLVIHTLGVISNLANTML